MATTFRKFKLSALKGVSFTLQSLLSSQNSPTHPLLIGGTVLLSVTLCYGAAHYKTASANRVEMNQLLDETEDMLSIDCVSEREQNNTTVHTEVAKTDAEGLVIDPHAGVVGGVMYDGSTVRVDLHRRVRRRNRAKYTNLIIAECKMLFGVPKHNEANCKAIRRYAVKLMKNHNVRPAHINVLTPKIVEMVFVPTKFDLEAKRLAASPEAYRRLIEYAGLAKSGAAGLINGTG